MTTSTTLRAYTAAAANLLTTELNALANSTNTVASGALTNATNLDLYMHATLVLGLQAGARTGTPTVKLYITPAMDGTNYDDVNESCAAVIATFNLDTATTARRVSIYGIEIPPGAYKVFARNGTGQALAATGNTITYRTYSLQTA